MFTVILHLINGGAEWVVPQAVQVTRSNWIKDLC